MSRSRWELAEKIADQERAEIRKGVNIVFMADVAADELDAEADVTIRRAFRRKTAFSEDALSTE